MTPYFTDEWLTVYGGDARTVLAELAAESVQCVVTSPPYWGLRDYGHGDQLGLEATPEQYVANMVGVFREVRRVLRPDGTLWLNLGDSYANTGGMTGGTNSKENGKRADRMFTGAYRPLSTGLKQKDLVGIPWRVAFALQADGWYLRSDIIWAKPNPMPESVTDRPTKSHEYLFLLTRSARYVYDAAAVAESATYAGPNGAQHSPYGQGFTRRSEAGILPAVAVPNPVEVVERAMSLGLEGDITDFVIANNRPPTWQERKAAGATAGNIGVSDNYQGGVHGEGLSHDLGSGLERNLRTVWTVATAPYPGAHFATFPPKLVEPCIKAGCPEGGVVLDPFAGTGTVGMVAQQLSRRAVLIDLNPDYLRQQLARNAQTPLGLVS